MCAAKLHNFILNCFSSDEAHKFSHKYFAVERIFAMGKCIQCHWNNWCISSDSHLQHIYALHEMHASLCAWNFGFFINSSVFHVTIHLSVCIRIVVFIRSTLQRFSFRCMFGFLSRRCSMISYWWWWKWWRWWRRWWSTPHTCDKQTLNHLHPLNIAHDLLIKLICILA